MFFSHSEKFPYRIVCLCLCNALCKTAASRENENLTSQGRRSRQQSRRLAIWAFCHAGIYGPDAWNGAAFWDFVTDDR